MSGERLPQFEGEVLINGFEVELGDLIKKYLEDHEDAIFAVLDALDFYVDLIEAKAKQWARKEEMDSVE